MNATEPNQLRSVREEIQTLLDDLRVKIHLAQMEARDEFAELAREGERLARGTGRLTLETAEALLARLQAFGETITQETED